MAGALVVFIVSMLADWLLLAGQFAPLAVMIISNVLVACIAGWLVSSILNEWLRRREAMQEYLKLVAEMNHHIRNGLSIIQLSAATTENRKAIATIQEGVDRIQWALRELLGVPRKPPQGSAATPFEKNKSHIN